MPSNLHFFLVDYLSILRLDSDSLDTKVEVWQRERGLENYRLTQNDEAYTELFNICGYKHTFSRNLLIVTSILMILLITIAAIFFYRIVKKLTTKPKAYESSIKLPSLKPRKKPIDKASWIINFSVRFVYEFCFEFIICFMLNLTAFKADARESDFIWAIALLCFVLSVALVVFLVSLFFRNGPYMVQKVYEEGSLMRSWWGARHLKSRYILKGEQDFSKNFFTPDSVKSTTRKETNDPGEALNTSRGLLDYVDTVPVNGDNDIQI